MKNTLTIILLLSFSIVALAQEKDHLFFLETDSTWRKELFIFPIGFAPDINYEGVEDARFPTGWEDQDSPNFWSYTFAWNIENSGKITDVDLKDNLEKYFNGLMNWQKTSVEILTTDETKNTANYTGIVKTIDSFFTKESMTLNVMAQKIYCEETNHSIILFRFSPKGFESKVWRTLEEVKLPISVANCQQTKAYKIHELIKTCTEYGQFNGSVLVAENGEIVYKNGFGFANMEWDIPNKPDTKHRLASISKQFTAMLIIQLFAENKLKLDVPITSYLPNYPKENGNKITIHHLLTHTSGIPNYTSFRNYRQQMRNYNSPMKLVSLFADSTLEFTPGEEFAYSNSGYVLLGTIIEKVTKKSYEQALKDMIFSPLNMNNTGYDHHRTVLKNRASGYNKNGNVYSNAGYIDMSTPYAAGAIYSTVEDMYLWDQALYTEKLIPKKYMDLLFEKHAPAWGGHYGYGWEISKIPIGNTEDRSNTIKHGGGINGFNTLITRIPSEKSLVLLFNNTDGAPLYDMTAAINGILHHKPYTFPKRSLAYSLLDAIEKDGITSALSYYKEIKDSDDYRIDENEMNMAGYQLLQSGKAEEAASVFKLNMETFTNSFNVYDSYGEALMVLGDSVQAIENYKKSVRLNPDNNNGIQILEGLGINTDDLIIKVPIEHLKLLAGEYMAIDQNRDWKIVIEEVNGELFGKDGGYRYKLNPVGDDKFINPDDGVTVVFDTKNKDAITFLIFERVTFKKVD